MPRPINKSVKHNGTMFARNTNFAHRILAASTLGFLSIGYLGVNLFDFSPEWIFSIRLIVFFIILLIFAMDYEAIKVDRPVLILGAAAAIGAISSSISLNLFFVCLFFLAVRPLSIQFLVAISIWVLGATIVISMVLVLTGIVSNVEDNVGVAFELGLGDELRTRMTFGYKNVNAFSSLISAFCLLFMFKGKNTVIRYALAICASYAFYLYTDSRTMLLTTFSVVFFASFFVLLVNYRRVFYLFSILFVSLPVVLAIVPDMVINQLPLIDFMLSGRFSFISAYLSELPAYRLLIGGMDPPPGLTVDNSYALILGASGLPILLFLAYRVIFVINHCVKNLDYKAYAFILGFWFFSFSESGMVRPETIICLIFWVFVLKGDALEFSTYSRIKNENCSN